MQPPATPAAEIPPSDGRIYNPPGLRRPHSFPPPSAVSDSQYIVLSDGDEQDKDTPRYRFEDEMHWQCPRCRATNTALSRAVKGTLTCKACKISFDRRNRIKPEPDWLIIGRRFDSAWICDECHLINGPQTLLCGHCSETRGNLLDKDTEIDSSIAPPFTAAHQYPWMDPSSCEGDIQTQEEVVKDDLPVVVPATPPQSPSQSRMCVSPPLLPPRRKVRGRKKRCRLDIIVEESESLQDDLHLDLKRSCEHVNCDRVFDAGKALALKSKSMVARPLYFCSYRCILESLHVNPCDDKEHINDLVAWLKNK